VRRRGHKNNYAHKVCTAIFGKPPAITENRSAEHHDHWDFGTRGKGDRHRLLPLICSQITLCLSPIRPYDLLIYAKNGHRPHLLEHLAEVFPRHLQIHYGQYRREELFEAARRSRACAYLADDDHGPLALQEILLAGCPTVGVRTGASFVRHGETGVVVDRLPPGHQCVETDEDVRALAIFMEAIEQAQTLDRHSVRDRAAEQFGTTRITDQVIGKCPIDC
jgi:hypothetical protein